MSRPQEITCNVVTRATSQIMNEVAVEKPMITAYPNPFNDDLICLDKKLKPFLKDSYLLIRKP